MEVLQKGKTISINPGHKFPAGKLLGEAAVILLFIWAIFTVLIVFFSRNVKGILPYFVAITLLLIIPLISGILVRFSRHYKIIIFDGEKNMLNVKGLWRWQKIAFNEVGRLKVNKYRIKKGLFLHRLDIVLVSGKNIQLIKDVPDKEALCSLGEKVGALANKPLDVST